MRQSSTHRRAPGRPQWHRIYYLLAMFDVLVVGLGIFLNHQIIDTHHESIRVNQVWESRLDRYLDLGTLAGDVNAPGNNVFDTRDVDAESQRQAAALVRFDSLTAEIQQDLRHVAPEYASVLAADLDRVSTRMDQMIAEARQIFRYFENDRPDLAGSRMAAMDRKYHAVNLAITRTREDVGEIQGRLFDQQSRHADTLRNWEYLIAAAVVLMISCATAYGHRIKRELEARDAEREQHVADVETSRAQLAAANASLTTEISGRVEAETRLALSEERYALAARGANDGLWDWDRQAGEVYFSPRWKALLGYAEEELSARPGEWFDRVHPDDLGDLHAHLALHHADGATFQLEHRVQHRDGTYRWMLVRGIRTRNRQGGDRLVGSLSDVTARKSAELDLIHDSLHDALTGLPNRVLFLERLDQARQRTLRAGTGAYAVLHIDLDRFKNVNDSLGHLAGDELLTGFAARLQRVVRPGDTLARLGGDEFALLLDALDTEADAVSVAERLLRDLHTPIQVDASEVHVTASIGIALSDTGDHSPSDLLRRADAALYRAKREGRAGYKVFDTTQGEQLLDALRLEADLRGAVARGELRLMYQPIVELQTREVVGFEALVRWKHPDLGLVPPSRFIPIAEESGDIVKIGDWVLQQACSDFADLSRGRAADSPLYVSVNVSPRQLLRPEFVTHVQNVLTGTAVTSTDLRLEITESVIMHDTAHAAEQLRRLRELGIRICIDDFGTGHSALAYVHDLPADCIKIDRSFIERLTTGANGAHIVHAILELARSTGLTVVAEGVELEEQHAALKSLSCEYGQGYLFGRPLHVTALERLLGAGALQAS